ncbi:MAG: YncE family protein [Flavobacteriales bacterium]
MKQFTLAMLAITLLFSCKKDDDEDPVQLPSTDERTVIIGNEGNFGSGNAELGIWGLESNIYAHGAYQEANGEVFGDVFQSYYRDGDRVFWVINSSGKIIATDLEGNKIGEITGLGSPRYFLPVDDQFAYVTDLFSGSITVVNHQTFAVDHIISTFEEASEELFLVGDKVYAIGSTLVDNVNFIYDYSVIEINISDESIQYAPVPHSVRDAEVNAMGDLLLAGSDSEFAPKLSVYSTWAGTFTDGLTEFSAGSISNVGVNTSTGEVYGLLDGDVYTLDIANNTMELITDLDLGFGYGFRVDNTFNEIYVCDAADFVSDGTVYRISNTGSILNEITAGPLPKDVLIP